MIDLISFKGAQYPKPVILYAVDFYVRFPVSYRDLEEIMAERGVDLDHATLNRWVDVERQPLCPRATTILAGFQAAEVGVLFGFSG